MFLYDQGGFILTQKEAKELFAKMQVFFDGRSEEEVDAHNQGLLNKTHGSLEPTPRKERTPQVGYVYLVGIRGDNLYKIGMTTKKPAARLAQFVPKMPYEADLVGTIKTSDALGLERELHKHYDSLGCERAGGEWFRLSDEAVAYFFDVKEETEGRHKELGV